MYATPLAHCIPATLKIRPKMRNIATPIERAVLHAVHAVLHALHAVRLSPSVHNRHQANRARCNGGHRTQTTCQVNHHHPTYPRLCTPCDPQDHTDDGHHTGRTRPETDTHCADDTTHAHHARAGTNAKLLSKVARCQVVSMCNCSAWCMIARRVSKPNICRLRILHCLCQHGCEPENFMFPRLSCVCIHLEMWAEVKVHSYHARAHVCVGSCMCCAQATPLSKLQWA